MDAKEEALLVENFFARGRRTRGGRKGLALQKRWKKSRHTFRDRRFATSTGVVSDSVWRKLLASFCVTGAGILIYIGCRFSWQTQRILKKHLNDRTSKLNVTSSVCL